MIRVGIIALILGGLLGYGIAYARFGDATIVDELRSQYSQLVQQFEEQGHELHEYREQNVILKDKAQTLLKQNDDYAKIVSQLNRYYYYLQKASDKVHELVEILQVEDNDLHRSLLRMNMPMEGNEDLVIDEPQSVLGTDTQEKRFF